MKYRAFGNSGESISSIGFGGWGIGGAPWGHKDDAIACEAICTALDEGINFFDTAYTYGNGHSEKLIGAVLQRCRARHRVFIATKIPPHHFRLDGNTDPFSRAYPKRWIRAATERSLRKLQTDIIDLQQLHTWLPSWLDDPEWMVEIEALKSKGYIRWFGVSVQDRAPDAAINLVKSGVIDAIQVPYNVLDQSAALKLFGVCKKHGVAVIVRSPLNHGALAGACLASGAFPSSDWRREYFHGSFLREIRNSVNKLSKILEGQAMGLVDASLRFCLAHPSVTTVIPGMRRPKHVQLCAANSDASPLSPKLRRALKGLAWN